MPSTIGTLALVFLFIQPAFGADPGVVRKPLEPMTRGAGANAIAHMAEEDRLDRLDAANRKLLDESKKNAIEFKDDSDDLKPGQEQAFKQLANEVVNAIRTLNQDFPKLRIVLEGHTENSGSASHDKELSERRASRVCSILVRYTGVECNAVGYGNTKPLVSPEDTPAKRAKNRRIVVQVAPK